MTAGRHARGTDALKRVAEPLEIAQAILYLTSSESSFITGAALAVDGGGPSTELRCRWTLGTVATVAVARGTGDNSRPPGGSQCESELPKSRPLSE